MIHSSTAPPLQEVACPLGCKASKRIIYDLRNQGDERRTVVECEDCSTLFVSPRLSSEQIAQNYTGRGYFQRKEGTTGYSNYLDDRELHRIFFKRQLGEIGKIVQPGRLLDVGCAGGFLVEEANRLGWQAEGVEVSDFASAFARDTLGLPVRSGTLREAMFPAGQFRVVVMDDVIEHLEDPFLEIQEVWRILESGGVFLLHTPNAASPWRKVMGKKWIHLKPDEHLFYFDPNTLSALLRRAGFHVLSVRTCSKATNLKYIVGVAGKISPRLSAVINRLLSRTPFWTRPFSFRGGGMQVIAQK